METHSRVYAAIHLDALEDNFHQIKAAVKDGTKMVAVVKTDGYGHGAVPIAKHIETDEALWGFATATVEEAQELRASGIKKPVLILGFTFPEHYETIADLDLRPTVFKRSMAEQLSETAERLGKVIRVHFALDTGMSRIGFPDTDESVEEIRKILQLPGIEAEGLFTHFARADEEDKSFTHLQFQRYQDFSRKLEKAGILIPIRHCSNSAGIAEFPEMNLDMVRPGIIIYGIYPSDEVQRDRIRLRPVMELKSHIAYIKEVGANVAVSYGGTFVTTRRTRIATIPVGYGDGYPRSLSNKGYVLIGGKKAPIIGKVCMDQFMVDVTDIPARELQEVTLMGRDGEEELPVERLSHLSGRFPYEFVCDIGKRVPRVYMK